MEPSIRTSGLTKTYAATTAVRDLSLAVPAGSVFGFLGSNGAGKTTTIRMLLGLVRPTSGSATVLGYDITRERRHIAPRVGAIVDAPCFYSYLGALPRALAFFLVQSGIDVSIGILAAVLTRSVIGGAFAGILGAYRKTRHRLRLTRGSCGPFAALTPARG